jgi:hypothetical protein
MYRQSKLFDGAADCGRLMNAASDPVKKRRFKELRGKWIALANESTTMSTARLLVEIAMIDKMQSRLDPKYTIQ